MKDIKEVTGGDNTKALVKGVSLRRPQEFRIYRATKELKGSASKWNVTLKQKDGYLEGMLFVEITVQTGIDANGNGKFAWDDKSKTIAMKLEAVDIGTILSVLNGISKEAKLFHKNKVGNAVMNLVPATNPGNFYLTISAQSEGKTKKVQQTLFSSDTEILKVLLKDAVSFIYNWR